MHSLCNSLKCCYLEHDAACLHGSYTELCTINERQEKRVQYHETRAQNLTIGYLILQAIYIIAVSESSSTSLQCRNWWVMFSISLSTSVVYFIYFLDAVNKFYWIQYYLEVNQIDLQTLRMRISEARLSDENKSHCQIPGDDGEPSTARKPDPLLLFKRKLCISITVNAMIAIAGFELYAIRLLLC